MRHYHIYSIEDEVAEAFFGEESKLFHLFLEAETANSSSKLKTLQKQIDYITKPISKPEIEKNIKRTLGFCHGYYTCSGSHLLKIPGLESRAELRFLDDFMLLKSSGHFEAETTFFEVLRQSERCLLAMEFQERRYGWLKPVKHTRII